LTKTNPAKLAQLLQEYRDKSSEYRDEDFSQQASSFIARIASDEKSNNFVFSTPNSS